ncbi:MAG: NnrS family protein [Burkholderiaceae bacterium]
MTDAASGRPSRFALWDLGFRPFYLAAGAFATISIPLWVGQYAGVLPGAWSHAMFGHAHEMLFGYAVAVIAGFLLTAVRVWTGQPTPTGPVLAALVLLWIAGRVTAAMPFGIVAAMVDAAFPIAIAIAIAIPLVRSRNQRNYFFVVLLLLIGVAALASDLSLIGVVGFPALPSLQAGLDVVTFLVAVVGGRVIPMFTNNGVPGTRATRNVLVERCALASLLALLLADAMQAGPWLIAAIAAIAAIAHAIRLFLWQPWRTWPAPLVWILHVSYGWIVVYLILRSSAALGFVATSLAIHALTIGAIAGMTLGMMTRTARGHTARPLKADRFEVACFLLIQCAAVSRVVGGIVLPGAYAVTVGAAGLFWTAAFAIFTVRYWPVLTRPRLDGKPG